MAPDELANVESVDASENAVKRKNHKVKLDTAAFKKIHPFIKAQIMEPRCKSRVWVYFQRLNTTIAKCRICNGNYKFGSSISNLSHHAKVKHGEIWKQGPVKFIEHFKLSQGHSPQSVNERGKQKQKNTNRRSRSKDSEETAVKIEPNLIRETDARTIEDEDIQKTLDFIYEKEDDAMMRSPSEACPINTHISRPQMQLQSSSNTFSQNDEHEIDFLRSGELINPNPLKNSTATSLHTDDNFQRLKEERMRAETNYFNKKAAFMERSAEYVEVQKRHLLLQTQKLEMEILALKKRGCPHS